jgi:hypothetical protein
VRLALLTHSSETFSTQEVRMLLQFFLERTQRVDTPTAIAINPRSSLRWALKTEETFHWMKMQ